MSAETPYHNPNADQPNPLGIDPSAWQLMQDLNTQIHHGAVNRAAVVAQAEGVVVSSEENKIGFNTEKALLEGFINMMHEPHPAVADAKDIIEVELRKAASEAILATLGRLASDRFRRLDNKIVGQTEAMYQRFQQRRRQRINPSNSVTDAPELEPPHQSEH